MVVRKFSARIQRGDTLQLMGFDDRTQTDQREGTMVQFTETNRVECSQERLDLVAAWYFCADKDQSRDGMPRIAQRWFFDTHPTVEAKATTG